MAVRLVTLLSRLGAVSAIFLLATATYTFAAEGPLLGSPTERTVAAAPPRTLLVPDVTGQVYIFAKGMLEDTGFAWQVVGPVQGYSSNVVESQRPVPGTRVLANGSPIIVLRLRRGSYPERGTPEGASPYPGKPARPPVAAAPVKKRPAVVERKAKPKPKVVSPPPARKPTPRPKPAARPQKTAARPPAFVVPGAPKEPLDEMPLPERARRLSAWLAAHPKPTDRNVQHWLYQHEWIVTGAKFGWWRGAEALRLLIAADRRAQAQWGIGRRSEGVARAALAQVQARAR